MGRDKGKSQSPDIGQSAMLLQEGMESTQAQVDRAGRIGLAQVRTHVGRAIQLVLQGFLQGCHKHAVT